MKISGKTPTENKILEQIDYTEKFQDYLSLEKEVVSFLENIERKGFIESSIESFSKVNDSTYIAEVNLKNTYSKIRIHLPENFIDERNYDELQFYTSEITTTYIETEFENIAYVLSYLNKLLTQVGNTFATVQLKNISAQKDSENILLADVHIDKGELRRITKINIEGYENFPSSFLKHTIDLKPGQLFDEEKLLEKSLLLENLGFVKNIKPPEILFTEDETEVFLYLEKNNNNIFDGIIGFATDEESGNIEFNGYLNLVLSNNLNYGEKLIVNYKNDGNNQEQFFIRTELPFLFQSPFGLEAELSIFNRDTTFTSVEQSLLVNYQLNTKTKLFSGYKSFRSENLNNEAAVVNLFEDLTSRFGVIGFSYQQPQNNSLFPYKTIINNTNEFGKRDIKGLNTNQIRTRLRGEHLFNLNFQNSIFIGGSMAALFSENYFINELFRFGGITSIRGFDENSIDASIYSVLNTEYRYLLSSDSYIHSILDFAYFENSALHIQGNLYSFGFGLGLQTKAGIFKLNIANGKQDSQSFRFSNTKIHLSLNAVF
ncbi:MAG TPA: POTRA domain-containing protein [Flavobacteriaceae bacterium]|nr:POTRA domain-containing protein [Flavobacteriaceae bacterium]